MIAALALLPGVGPLIAIGSKVVSYILQCTICMVAIAVVVAWIAGDIHGHKKEKAICKAADIAMQLKAAQRDSSIAADTAKLAMQQADDLAKVNSDLNAKVASYEKTLAARSGPGCPLSADDLRRLRDIRQP